MSVYGSVIFVKYFFVRVLVCIETMSIIIITFYFYLKGSHSTGGLCWVGHHCQHPKWLERRLGSLKLN